MVAIRFTGNYEDLSTDRGFQFKFFCEKCNNGYMSTFKTSTMGVLGSAARVAGSLFGGVFGSVADSTYEVQRAVGGPAHDSALKEAGCAPDLDEEMASAQAEAAREQIQAKAREVDWTKSRNVDQVSGAVCGSCGAKSQGGKFCPECGTAYSPKKKCTACGHEAEGTPKFCPECGGKYA